MKTKLATAAILEIGMILASILVVLESGKSHTFFLVTLTPVTVKPALTLPWG